MKNDKSVIAAKTAWDKASALADETYGLRMEKKVFPWLTSAVKAGTMEGEGGLTLQYYTAIPEDMKGGIVFSHGYCEFFGKYHEMGALLYEAGYGIFFLEHRGHGRSGRQAASPEVVHVDDFAEYVADLKRFYDSVAVPAVPAGKRFLFAHSMGGAIGALYLEKHPDDFDRAILDAPMLAITFGGLPFPLVKAAILKARLFGQLKDPSPGAHAFDPHLPDEVPPYTDAGRNAYQFYQRVADPCYRTCCASSGWVDAAIRGMECAVRDAARIRTETLLFQMEHDTLVLPGAQEELLRKAQAVEKYLVEGAPHEPFNGDEALRARHFSLITEFFGE
ncbi:MAG: alpha/beta fold hydrolase [Lachnospiraceae bacterium]|nr:alpha/beta fold hydrolase [Lachnospiraceae bacterium]